MPKEETAERTLRTSQIGRCGELLVQYQLLLRGIDSSPMSTDVGVDLVAYSPAKVRPFSIQVKTNLKAKPGGGRGKSALDWWIPVDPPVDLVALVDLSSEKLWLFLREEVPALAQQTSNGRHHLYMYTDPTHRPRVEGRLAHIYEFEKYLLKNRTHDIFGI